MSDDGAATGLGPTPPGQRVATLDVLRGTAILGILLVNIEVFRGGRLYRVMAGQPASSSPAGEVVDFAVGWLVNSKFLASFALLFGVGAAMMIARARHAGQPPRGLLARRYAWLAVIGLAHMVLLFSGDILFVYAVTGAVLLAFTHLAPRALLVWAAGLFALCAVAGVAAWAAGTLAAQPTGGDPAVAQPMTGFVVEQGAAARAAFTQGSLVDQVVARSIEAAIVQANQLLALPWLLALFLMGMAIGRSGLVWSLPRHRGLLARVAAIAIPVGLVLNLPLGWAGALGGSAAGTGVASLGLLARLVGAPVLAVGYLAAWAWVCQRPGWLAWLQPLRQTGRMALTAYLVQSVLCTTVFVWFGLYGRLSQVEALGVVGAVWVVDVTACTAWLRRFAMGPVERLWRWLTYNVCSPANRQWPRGRP
jgi:uncharacterized protein